jgi:Mlc titration factor MtfA (ptsG expression regulator)
MKNYLSFLEGKARFSAWLIIFFILLLTVPILLKSDFKVLAKVIGVIVILTLSVALWIWRTQTIRNIKRKARVSLNLNDGYWLNDHILFYQNLNKKAKTIFEDRIGLFLAEIEVTEVGKAIAEKSTCLYVASSAVITFWGLPYWNYGELSEVLVYPSDFTISNGIDEKGIVQGKIHHGGLMDSIMILSLTSLINGFKLNDSKNVGILEFTHLLDKADDSIDGLPFYLTKDERLIWTRVFEKELISKKGISKINPYAFKNQSEFFAVLMETYIENPIRIKKRYPELFEILERNLDSNVQ